MKKSLLLAAVVLLSVMGLNARPYHHSVGINVGNVYGLSYKGYVRSSDHFIVITDLNAKIGVTGKSTAGYFMTDNNYDTYLRDDLKRDMSSTLDPMAYFSVEANPNLGYQGDIKEFNALSLHWFVGGGIHMGYGQIASRWSTMNKASKDLPTDLTSKEAEIEGLARLGVDAKDLPDAKNQPWFKCGANALVGLEVCFKDAPLNLSVDFRPGWSELISTNKAEAAYYKGGTLYNVDCQQITSIAMFDWILAVSLRYRIK